MEIKEPKVAFIAIQNKNNSPILLRNYLVETLKIQSDYSDEELEILDLQLKMLAYQSLDLFDEKQKMKPPPRAGNPYPVEQTYMGLIMETFLETYALDIYGYITNTNYKYIIIKNENKTNQLGQKPNDTPIKNLFKVMIKLHIEMMLNPFFDPFEKPEEDNEEDAEAENAQFEKEATIQMSTFKAAIDQKVEYNETHM